MEAEEKSKEQDWREPDSLEQEEPINLGEPELQRMGKEGNSSVAPNRIGRSDNGDRQMGQHSPVKDK